VESDRNYSTFYLVNEEHPVTVTKSMRNFVDVLEDYGFVRVHQSHVINTDHIVKYQKNDCVIVMRDDSQVPVSTRKRDFLLKRFEEL
ncbi:MAG TPA: LytTR family DNA-binding domain-containing protein, partial [Bacteroidales bacterium]|nr:LytTR family DNA-binding domain-containing protein [Bacteroidales bacterium]